VDAANTDVYRTVEYGLERYWINRIPLALLGCAASLFMIAMDPGPPGLLPLLLIGALLAFGAIYGICSVAFAHAFDSDLKPVRSVAFVLTVALGAVVFFITPSRYHRTSIYDPGFQTMGWMFVIFSLGYIAIAILKQVRPGAPVLKLVPTGLVFNYPWLKDLRIPWYEVEHVGLLEHILPGGIVSRFPNNPVIAVSQEFYERNILPRRSFLSGNHWTGFFQPKGAQVQILLPWPWFSTPMEEVSAAVDARWKAFREQPDAQAPPTTAPPLRASAWSLAALTRWRKVAFGVPAAGLILMLVHFAGVWDTAFLKTAREDFGKQRADKEAVRDDTRKGKFTIDGGQGRR
jgi:hypothetical protein